MNLVGSSHESNFIRIELRIVAFHGRIINLSSTKMAGQAAACSLDKDTPLVWLDTSLLLCNRKLHQASALKTSSFSTSSWQTSAELHDCFHICLIEKYIKHIHAIKNEQIPIHNTNNESGFLSGSKLLILGGPPVVILRNQ